MYMYVTYVYMYVCVYGSKPKKHVGAQNSAMIWIEWGI